MRRELVRSLIVAALSIAVLGIAYPVVLTLVGQTAFPAKANGSLISRDGRTVGSSLIAQAFTGTRYFHPRPSAVDYDAMSTGGSNLGPNSRKLSTTISASVAAVLRLEGPYNPGLTAADMPVDAVTSSFSGVDPQISVAYANLQSARVAAVRGLPPATVRQLISQNTDGRFLGLFGEPGVNVLRLNLALDRTAS